MPMDEPEPIPTERVAPAISSPLLHQREMGPRDVAFEDAVAFEAAEVLADEAAAADGLEVAPEIPPIVAAHPTWLVTAAVGIGAMAASGDPRVGLALGGIVGLAGLIRSADRRLPFSFGEGFVAYRADLGWPRGVQEDDDVRWSVRPTRSPQPAALPPAGPISGR
jgi:hypothetical protein